MGRTQLASTQGRGQKAEKLRIGIIGFGIAGEAHWAALSTRDDTEVVAVCRRDQEALLQSKAMFGADFAAYEDPAQMIAEQGLDGLVIASSTSFLAEHASLALDKVPNILLEKPAAPNSDALRKLTLDAEQSASRVLVGYSRRFRKHFCKAKEWIDQGLLGTGIHVSVDWAEDYLTRYQPSPGQRPTHRWNPEEAVGGVLLDSGSHVFDTLTWLLGSVPSEVTAQLGFSGGPLETSAAITLRFPENTLASCIIRPAMPSHRTRRLVFEGSAGRLVIDDGQAVLSNSETSEVLDSEREPMATQDAFVEMIVGNTEPVCTLSSAITPLAIVDACYTAHRLSQCITLEDGRGRWQNGVKSAPTD